MTYESKYDYKEGRMGQPCWHKSVSVMMWSSVRHNHTDNNINKYKNEKEMGEKRGGGLSLLEGDAWNIATYKLVPDLWGDSFIVGYHIL